MAFLDDLKKGINERLDDILKSGEGIATNIQVQGGESLSKSASNSYYSRVSLVDPNLTAQYGGAGYGPYRPRYSHISFKTLKEMSLRDSIVASIIQTRINQMAAFGRPQQNRYDTGFKIMPKDPSLEIAKDSDEEKEIKFLTEYVCNTGVEKDRDPKDKMDFETWLRLITRDRLTYGAVAIETIRDMEKRIHSFLPVPTETVYYANKAISDEFVEQLKDINKKSYLAGYDRERRKDIDLNRWENGEYEYVQVIEGKVVEAFSRLDMLYKLGNPQNFIDNNGYAIGELEMATTTITSHLQAENYNKLFFTHGFAARGLLHIEGDVTPAQLQAFRAQWYSQISGNQNSWRTPIIAGVDQINWIPLAANNKEMEYSGYVDHIIRTLCALFQISPMEIGFDYLTRGSGQKTLSESDNEWKIQESQDRGLRPLLTWIEGIINNEIIPQIEPKFCDKYKFCFVGLDAESKQEEMNRQTAELELHSSLNDIRKEIDKDPVEIGGKMPLNLNYINYIKSIYTVGQIREFIEGETGASKDPELHYIDSAGWFNHQGVLHGSSPEETKLDEDGNSIKSELDETGNLISPPEGNLSVDIEDIVAVYLENHPELLEGVVEKSLNKSVDRQELTAEMERARKAYLDTYKSMENKMIQEILKEVVKEEFGGDEESIQPEEDSE